MHTRLKTFLSAAFLAVLLIFPVLSFSQSSGQVNAVTPMTRDLPVLQTLTSQVAATVTSSDQSGFNVARVTCIFRQSASSGSPSSTFSLQGKDPISGQYYTLLTSAAVTNTSTNPIYVGAGVTTTANVSAGLPIPRVWRTTVTVGGTSTPLVTGTVGCSVQ